LLNVLLFCEYSSLQLCAYFRFYIKFSFGRVLGRVKFLELSGIDCDVLLPMTIITAQYVVILSILSRYHRIDSRPASERESE